MADKEYIERGALLKTPPFTKYGGDSNWYTEGYLDCAEEARKAVNDVPAADVVSRGVFDQIKWERDMAMQQLEEHGIPFGGKADVVEVEKVAEMLRVMFDDDSACNYNGNDEWLPLVCEFLDECPMPKERLGCWKQFVKHFLAKMDGERKEQT